MFRTPPLLAILALVALSAAATALAQPRPTESGFLQVEPDIRLYYQRFGTGTPTVFSPMRTEMVVTFGALLERFDVVLWDARGFGLSDRPDDFSRVGLEAEIADTEAMRRHFGADRIYYVGGSLWGFIGMLYAARHPESVAGVVAMAPLAIAAALMEGEPEKPVAHDLSATVAEIEAMEADGRAERDPYTYCVLQYRVDFAVDYVDLANYAKFEAANVCQYPNWRLDLVLPLVFEGIFGSFGDWDWRAPLATVQAPVVLLYGDHEIWPLVGVRAYTEVVPNVAWREFEDTGHHVWNERTDEVLAMLDTFFRGSWPDGVTRR
jgi:proline iminopeptidase